MFLKVAVKSLLSRKGSAVMTLMAISVITAEPLRLSKLFTATFKNMFQQGLCVMSDSASRRVKCSASAMS